MRWSRPVLAFALLTFLIGASCSLFSDISPEASPTPDPQNDDDGTLQFIPDVLPDAQQGVPYEIEVRVENVTTFVGEFTVTEGILPPGLLLERVPSENATLITGIPQEAGTFSFTLDVWCMGTNDPGQTGHHLYQIIVR